MPRLILASASPRRSELLALLERPFEVRVADVDESVLPGEAPAVHVERLARLKATTVATRLADEHAGALDEAGETIVIGADTVVVLDGEVVGKPDDARHATRILRRLSGRDHQVLSGVAVCRGERVHSAVAHTLVGMRTISDDEITRYVASGEPLDKAGAYGIQGAGGRFVEHIDGSYHNVVGLPLTVLEALLGATA